MCVMPEAPPLSAPAKAICSGIAGVNGPAQKAMIAVHAVQYHGLTMSANTPHTITGDQNMISLSSNHTMLCPHHRSALRRRVFVVCVIFLSGTVSSK